MYTIWLFNIAMENGPFIDGLPIKNGDFSMAMLNDQRVYIYIYAAKWDDPKMISHSNPKKIIG